MPEQLDVKTSEQLDKAFQQVVENVHHWHYFDITITFDNSETPGVWWHCYVARYAAIWQRGKSFSDSQEKPHFTIVSTNPCTASDKLAQQVEKLLNAM